MKKILLFFITVIVLISCDPESVFIESQEYGDGVEETSFVEKTLYQQNDFYARKEIKSITYEGHEYLIVSYSNGHGVDVEIVEIHKNQNYEK